MKIGSERKSFGKSGSRSVGNLQDGRAVTGKE